MRVFCPSSYFGIQPSEKGADLSAWRRHHGEPKFSHCLLASYPSPPTGARGEYYFNAYSLAPTGGEGGRRPGEGAIPYLRILQLCLPVLWVCVVFPAVILGDSFQALAQAQEHADRGLQLAQNGDLKKAEAELRRAVELAPHDPAFLASLGGILGMQQKLGESNLYLERALSIDPNDSATRRNLASNQFQLGQLQSAKENLDRVLKARPSDKTSVLLAGMVAEELKDYSRAAKLLGSVPEQVRERSKSIVALARSYYNVQQKDRARETLKDLQGHSEGPEGVFLGAQVAAEAKDYETAEQMFQSISSIYPNTAKLGYSIALVLYRSDRIEEAHATLDKLICTGHGTSDIYNLLSWCFQRKGKLKEAVAAMDQAIELDPSRESNYVDLADILITHKRFKVALEAARKAVEVAPASYQAYKLKGMLEAKTGHRADAIKAYQRAVELNPEVFEAILGLALAQSADGLAQEAAATFEQAIKRFPNQPKLYQEYARVLLDLSAAGVTAAESQAISLLERAIALDSSLAEPHSLLGGVALNKGKPQEALQHLQVAAQLDGKSRMVHFLLARAYRRLGRNEEAAKERQIFESLLAEEEKSMK